MGCVNLLTSKSVGVVKVQIVIANHLFAITIWTLTTPTDFNVKRFTQIQYFLISQNQCIGIGRILSYFQNKFNDLRFYFVVFFIIQHFTFKLLINFLYLFFVSSR